MPGHPTATLLLGTATPQLPETCRGRRRPSGELAAGQPGFRPPAAGTRTHAARAGRIPGARAALTRAVRARAGAGGGAGANSRSCTRSVTSRARAMRPTHASQACAPRITTWPRQKQRLPTAAWAPRTRCCKRALAAHPMTWRRCACRRGRPPRAMTTSRPNSLLGEMPADRTRRRRGAPGAGEVLHAQQKAAAMLPLLERLLVLEPADLRTARSKPRPTASSGRTSVPRRSLRPSSGIIRTTNGRGCYYGHVLRSAGRLEQAIAAYRRSTELQPQFGEAWFSLANLKTLRFSAADAVAMRAAAGAP